MMLVTLPNAYGDAATNMAIDAALLRTVPKQIALFRHYGWTEPTVTFGYSQSYAEVQTLMSKENTLCRRLSGGGIVDHRNDWTYSLVLHSGIDAARENSSKLYGQIHQAIASSLKNLSINTQLAPCPRKCNQPLLKSQGPQQCFIQPVVNDVLTNDGAEKIAGAAMKRNRNGLLIQGSINRSTLPDNFDFETFKKYYVQRLSEIFNIPQKKPEDLRRFFDSDAISAERQRFKSIAWNRKR